MILEQLQEYYRVEEAFQGKLYSHIHSTAVIGVTDAFHVLKARQFLSVFAHTD